MTTHTELGAARRWRDPPSGSSLVHSVRAALSLEVGRWHAKRRDSERHGRAGN